MTKKTSIRRCMAVVDGQKRPFTIWRRCASTSVPMSETMSGLDEVIPAGWEVIVRTSAQTATWRGLASASRCHREVLEYWMQQGAARVEIFDSRGASRMMGMPTPAMVAWRRRPTIGQLRDAGFPIILGMTSAELDLNREKYSLEHPWSIP